MKGEWPITKRVLVCVLHVVGLAKEAREQASKVTAAEPKGAV